MALNRVTYAHNRPCFSWVRNSAVTFWTTCNRSSIPTRLNRRTCWRGCSTARGSSSRRIRLINPANTLSIPQCQERPTREILSEGFFIKSNNNNEVKRLFRATKRTLTYDDDFWAWTHGGLIIVARYAQHKRYILCICTYRHIHTHTYIHVWHIYIVYVCTHVGIRIPVSSDLPLCLSPGSILCARTHTHARVCPESFVYKFLKSSLVRVDCRGAYKKEREKEGEGKS